MDSYKEAFSPREALFACGNLRILPSFWDAALISYRFNNWRRVMPVKPFKGFLCISYRRFLPPNYEINRPISSHTDRVIGLYA
jgi:hypothetical protein